MNTFFIVVGVAAVVGHFMRFLDWVERGFK